MTKRKPYGIFFSRKIPKDIEGESSMKIDIEWDTGSDRYLCIRHKKNILKEVEVNTSLILDIKEFLREHSATWYPFTHTNIGLHEDAGLDGCIWISLNSLDDDIDICWNKEDSVVKEEKGTEVYKVLGTVKINKGGN